MPDPFREFYGELLGLSNVTALTGLDGRGCLKNILKTWSDQKLCRKYRRQGEQMIFSDKAASFGLTTLSSTLGMMFKTLRRNGFGDEIGQISNGKVLVFLLKSSSQCLGQLALAPKGFWRIS